MGEFLRKIQKKKNDPGAIAHKIALLLSTFEMKALIVESRDDAFFYDVLYKRRKNHVKMEIYPGFGRDNVISILKILENLGKSEVSFGIVDRDFNLDDPSILSGGRCLVLDVYSFENYAANESLLIEYGKSMLGMEFGEDALVRWISCVTTFLANFPDILIEEHVIAYWCRKNNIVCNLSDFRVGSWISCGESGGLSRRVSIEEGFRRETGANFSEIPNEEGECIRRIFKSRHWTSIIRGHYFWKLLLNFINTFRISLDEERKKKR